MGPIQATDYWPRKNCCLGSMSVLGKGKGASLSHKKRMLGNPA